MIKKEVCMHHFLSVCLALSAWYLSWILVYRAFSLSIWVLSLSIMLSKFSLTTLYSNLSFSFLNCRFNLQMSSYAERKRHCARWCQMSSSSSLLAARRSKMSRFNEAISFSFRSSISSRERERVGVGLWSRCSFNSSMRAQSRQISPAWLLAAFWKSSTMPLYRIYMSSRICSYSLLMLSNISTLFLYSSMHDSSASVMQLQRSRFYSMFYILVNQSSWSPLCFRQIWLTREPYRCTSLTALVAIEPLIADSSFGVYSENRFSQAFRDWFSLSKVSTLSYSVLICVLSACISPPSSLKLCILCFSIFFVSSFDCLYFSILFFNQAFSTSNDAFSLRRRQTSEPNQLSRTDSQDCLILDYSMIFSSYYIFTAALESLCTVSFFSPLKPRAKFFSD